MLTPLAIVSLLSMPAEAGSFCYDGGIRHSAASLSPIETVAIPAPEDDPRYGLHEALDRYDFSPEEVEEIPKVTGTVRCPRTATEDGSFGNGFIVGASADSILTNAHLSKSENGTNVLKNMSTCYFATTAEPDKHYELRYDDDHAKYGSKAWLDNLSRDFVVVKLKKPVPNVHPLRISTMASQLNASNSIYMISNKMRLMPPGRVVLNGEPVIQQCPFIGYEPIKNGDGQLLRTGCATEIGNSGSMLVLRNPDDKKLEIVAVHRGGGAAKFDGKPVDVNAGNYEESIPVDGPLKRNLDSFLRSRQADSH